MTNQLPNEFKGEGKTGRFWLSPYHLMEAKHALEIENSRIKRGERGPLKSKWKHHAWGCGCCLYISEFRSLFDVSESEADRIARIYEKKRRTVSYVEVGGRRVRLNTGSAT